MRHTDDVDAARIATVAEAIATAEAWNERAAILSTMAFELRTVFGRLHGSGPVPYFIRRIGGGASPASVAVIEEVRAELFVAAEHAREEARKIVMSATSACSDRAAPGLVESDVAPSVDRGSIVIPSGGYEIVENADCPARYRKLGDGPRPGDDREEQKQGPEEQGRALRAVEPPPAVLGESDDRRSVNIRPLRPKARTR